MESGMLKYTAKFIDGWTITRNEADGFRNRLDFYNWICRKQMGREHGPLVEIKVSAYGCTATYRNIE